MTVLVVGGGRGIGASLVNALDRRGVGGVFTYRSSGARATRLAARCRSWRARHLDLLGGHETSEVLAPLGGEISTVLLCAAAGLESEPDATAARTVNATAPANLVRTIADGNRVPFAVIYVTSTDAHHHLPDRSDDEEPDMYDLTARTKREGESLLADVSDGSSGCRSFTAVVADLVVPSTAHTIYRRRDPGAVDRLVAAGRWVDLATVTDRLVDATLRSERGERLPRVIRVQHDS
ncbi:hypothetical protein ACU6RU_08415 [Microbacterium sp. F1-18]